MALHEHDWYKNNNEIQVRKNEAYEKTRNVCDLVKMWKITKS